MVILVPVEFGSTILVRQVDVCAQVITFDLDGVPTKGRPRTTFRNGRPVLYTPQETRRSEKRIANAYVEASQTMHGHTVKAEANMPVSVWITVRGTSYRSRPAYIASQIWKMFHHFPFTQKPDIDNIAKVVLDGLNGVAWADDAQVTQLAVVKQDRTDTRAKRRPTKAGITVTVLTFEEVPYDDGYDRGGCENDHD